MWSLQKKLDAIIAAINAAASIVINKATLSSASETVAAGYYDATTLSAVDAELVTGNIKSGITIFGIAGTSTVVDVSDTTAAAGDVKVGKYFYTAAGARIEGTLP